MPLRASLLTLCLILSACTGAKTGTQAGMPKASASPDPTVTVAGKVIRQLLWIKALQGSLAFVGQIEQRGQDTASLLTQLLGGLVVNGIDYGSIAQYKPGFSGGIYTFTKGTTGMSFTLAYAKDFGEHKSGEAIADNLFSPASFVVNPRLEGLVPTYDPGPLVGIVSGDIGLGLDLTPKVKIDTSTLAFEVASTRRYGGTTHQSDFIDFKMASTRTSLDTFNDQLDKGGFGLQLDGTAYDSSFFGIKQTFTGFPLLIKRDKDGSYFDSTFKAKATKDDLSYYLTGKLSGRVAASAIDYFEDEALAKPIGTLKFSADAKVATFVWADGGPSLPVTLEPF